MNIAMQFHYKIKTNQPGNVIVAIKVLLTIRFLWTSVIGQAILNVMASHKYFLSFLYQALSAGRLICKGCVPWPLEAAWEQCSCTALCWRLGLRDCRACTASSKTFHLPVLNHVISPGAKTFAVVG